MTKQSGNSTLSIGLALVAILIAALAYFHTGVSKAVTSLGSFAGAGCNGSVTCLLGDFNISGILSYGGQSPAGSAEQTASVGTCASGSIPFAVQNPFNATSTASVVIYGAGQATSTEITTSTSTTATGFLTTLAGSLTNAAVVATSSQFYLKSGATTMLGSGQISAGTNTVSSIVVGPLEYVGANATSTYGNAGAINYTAGLASCTYKVKWDQ